MIWHSNSFEISSLRWASLYFEALRSLCPTPDHYINSILLKLSLKRRRNVCRVRNIKKKFSSFCGIDTSLTLTDNQLMSPFGQTIYEIILTFDFVNSYQLSLRVP